jgi:Ni,Fe-hydrogenase III large subunit
MNIFPYLPCSGSLKLESHPTVLNVEAAKQREEAEQARREDQLREVEMELERLECQLPAVVSCDFIGFDLDLVDLNMCFSAFFSSVCP